MEELLDRGTDRLALHTFAPESGDAPTLAVLWPAMGVPARYYRSFAASLASHGVAVTVADLRGTGASTPRASRASRYGFAELADDVDAVLEHLKPARAGRRTVLVGHSLGGQMCALHLALRGASSDVSGLALLAVGLPYWRSYPSRGPQILAMTQTLAAGSAVLRYWPGWAFGGRQARGVIADWAYTARAGRYRPIAGVDVEAALARVTTPVLAVDIEGDQYTPAPTVDRLTSKLTSAEVRREHYAAAEAGARIDHFTWAKNGAPLAARVADWTASLP
ncbi:alpha/beta fold hydrolase [Dactylosporangium sp. AC04546]|uniref:alpha/beta hydrolase family protein n=1 Tax=Dactylosporangium sp. AC04546 TaxID=2862460 RepID=UPI001EDFC2CB|nr:alpha/beta fold hydrolase [Dactylosporangium sp. AC04546]WVK82215.1 alpha/beta fold hydrolase [Dactylosporangium sp. AC04546]